MSKEEYDILLWVIGNFASELNLAAGLIMASSATVSFIGYLANKLQAYILYRFDVEFWTNTLSV